MNYSDSNQILERIKTSKKILLNIHHNPDADSVGSAVAWGCYLTSRDKNFKIITSTRPSKNLEFLFTDFGYEVVDFSQFNFGEFDLLIANDSSSWSRASGTHDFSPPDIFTIMIDHHKTNQKFGQINLLIPDASANCLIIYQLFRDMGINFDEKISESLLTGILGDTGALRFPEAGEESYHAALQLMKQADKNKIIFNLYQSYEESHINVWKEIFNNIKIDKDNGFVYSFIRRDIMQKNNYPDNAKAELADMMFQSIEGTDFGLVGAEADGYISVSLRARKEVDVSILASNLGGGGHRWAAAARVWEGDFDTSVNKILGEARKFANEIKA